MGRRRLSDTTGCLAGSGDWETDLLCEGWELEGRKEGCKFTVNTTASINMRREKGEQENKFRVEMRGEFLIVVEMGF